MAFCDVTPCYTNKLVPFCIHVTDNFFKCNVEMVAFVDIDSVGLFKNEFHGGMGVS